MSPQARPKRIVPGDGDTRHGTRNGVVSEEVRVRATDRGLVVTTHACGMWLEARPCDEVSIRLDANGAMVLSRVYENVELPS